MPSELEQAKGNPFTPGRVVEPARFKGRWRELAEIRASLEGMGSISLVGEARIGKSSLLRYIEANLRSWLAGDRRCLAIYMSGGSAGDEGCQDTQGFCASVLARLLPALLPLAGAEQAHVLRALGERLANGPPPTLDETERALKWAAEAGLRVVLLLDEFKHVLERTAEFDDAFFQTMRPLYTNSTVALVLATRQPITDIPGLDATRLYFANGTTMLELGELLPEEAREVLSQPHDRPFSDAEIDAGLRASRDHPLRLQSAGWQLYEWHSQSRALHDNQGDLYGWVVRTLNHEVERRYRWAMAASRRPPRAGGLGRLLDRIGQRIVRLGDGISDLNARLYAVVLLIGLAVALCAVVLYATGLITSVQLRELWQMIKGP